MKRIVTHRTKFQLLRAGALGALLILPLACGDDDVPGGTGGGGSSGRGGGGGAKDAASDTRIDARTDSGGAGGAANDAASDALVDRADTGIVSDAAGSDGDGGPNCTNPAMAGRGKACLVFTPETMQVANADPQLDGRGTLFIHVFGTPTPGDTTLPIAQIIYPPPGDAGLNQTSVYGGLPQIDIDDLPIDLDGSPGTVYIRTLFVDNPAWLLTQRGLTYGMFVGGFNLNNGVQPPPPLRPVMLDTTGKGTVVPQPLTALRRFSTVIAMGLPDGGAPAGNGQGPLSVGAFVQASPANASVFGGAQAPCVDVTKGNIAVTGFFYAIGGERDFWFGAQVDDFGAGTQSAPGALVSLTALGEIPPPQRITITADQYSATIPQVTLTGVRPPAPDAGVDNVSCPTGDAGADASRDTGGGDADASTDTGGSDVGSDAVGSDGSDASGDGAGGDADGSDATGG